jgi:hypothetical protein
MMPCANRSFYFGERRVSLSRLEMVVIRPAGGTERDTKTGYMDYYFGGWQF